MLEPVNEVSYIGTILNMLEFCMLELVNEVSYIGTILYVRTSE